MAWASAKLSKFDLPFLDAAAFQFLSAGDFGSVLPERVLQAYGVEDQDNALQEFHGGVGCYEDLRGWLLGFVKIQPVGIRQHPRLFETSTVG